MVGMATDKLRNIVLLSHSGAGKTILAEAMLHATGAASRMGTVEEGTTMSDFEPEETRRQTSVQTSILRCTWRDHKLNILDTPGYADFRGEVISAVRVADAAVIAVAAPSGVEVGTQQMWKLADERNLPRIVFVTKMDRENADFQAVVDSLSERFGRHCVPVHIPIGAANTFSGIVNLLDPQAQVPDEVKDEVESARERLIEGIAEADDDLATKYLEGEELDSDELTQGLKQGIASGAIVPVLAGASPSGLGIKEVLDAIVDYLPSPAETAPASAKLAGSGDEVSLPCDSDGPLAALVFKTSADPFVGKLSYFRVYSGTLKSDTQVWNANKGEPERVGQAFVVMGKNQEAVPELVAGDIGAVTKLSTVLTWHTITNRDQPVILSGMEFPSPVYRMAVYPKSKSDVDKMTSSLTRIAEEDPSLVISRDSETGEVLMGGLGDTHVEVAVEKMRRKFGVELVLQLPKIAYKETIASTTRVEYKHKKQTGGHGQYGHVWLSLEPMPRDAGFEFGVAVVGGAVPKEYIPSVEKGVHKALAEGVIAGYPLVDLKATLVDGSYHPVDSSGVCFEIAGASALSKGVQQASPVLLEPVVQAQVVVPDQFAGDVVGELNSKRGRIQGVTPQGDGTTFIEAEVPQAEMLRYATELRSHTQGQGSFTMEFARYEEVPQHLVQRIVEARKQKEEVKV